MASPSPSQYFFAITSIMPPFVCCVWRRVFGSLVVVSLSCRVVIIVGCFRPRTRLLGGRGGSKSPPARPTARSTDRLPYRPSLHAHVALTWQSAESTSGLLWPCETTTSATVEHAHLRALVARCTCHRAAGPVAARDCRARTGAHATLSSCRLTEAKSMITIVTW